MTLGKSSKEWILVLLKHRYRNMNVGIGGFQDSQLPVSFDHFSCLTNKSTPNFHLCAACGFFCLICIRACRTPSSTFPISPLTLRSPDNAVGSPHWQVLTAPALGTADQGRCILLSTASVTFCCCDTDCDQKQLGEEGACFSLHTYCSPPSKEVRMGSQKQELKPSP